MLRVLLPLVAAILLSNVVVAPLWVSLIFICAGALWLTLRYDTIAIYLIIFGFGLTVSTPSSTPSLEPLATADKFALKPLNSYSAEVIAYRDAQQEWRSSGAKLYISSTERQLSSDSLTLCSARFYSPVGDASAARLYISALHRSLLLSDFGIKPSLGAKLHSWALSRVERLSLSPTPHASVVAMSLGERRYLDFQTIEDYRRSGTAHLLALSGLHIGVVFLVLRALLFIFPLLRYGHIVGDILTIIFIWLFAAMAGFGDSIVRAAAMFSLLQLSRIVSQRYDSLSSLFAAASLMLLFDPLSLYDLGFQLSFVAVAAIIVWAVPLFALVRSRSALLNAVSSSIIMGVIATIATAPIICYSFGYISFLSPLVTLPLLATLTTIIITSIVWILMPMPLLAPLFREILTVATTIQNFIAEWVAQLGWGYFEYRITKIEMAIIYTLYLIVAFATTYYFEHKTSEFSPSKALRRVK